MGAEIEPKGSRITGLNREAEWIRTHHIGNARRLITAPEYFFQQPTAQQEERCKRKDYSFLWERLAAENNIRVPRTIKTYFGKVEFIRDELHFRDFCNVKYQDQDYQDLKDRIVDYESLRKERWEASKKLNRLSKEDVEKLRAKTANAPLQQIDFGSGELINLPSWY